jgi:predicted ester cyclase
VTGLDDATNTRRERNEALVRRYKLEILNGRRLAALGEVASDDYLDHAAFPGQAPGLAGFRERLEALIRAFDPRWTILDLVADADTAVVRWALQGIHRDVFLGFAPTGRSIELHGIDMYRIQAGKLAEHWNVVDLSPLARGALDHGQPLARA